MTDADKKLLNGIRAASFYDFRPAIIIGSKTESDRAVPRVTLKKLSQRKHMLALGYSWISPDGKTAFDSGYFSLN